MALLFRCNARGFQLQKHFQGHKSQSLEVETGFYSMIPIDFGLFLIFYLMLSYFLCYFTFFSVMGFSFGLVALFALFQS